MYQTLNGFLKIIKNFSKPQLRMKTTDLIWSNLHEQALSLTRLPPNLEILLKMICSNCAMNIS
ncbi:MAG: hypothetical protein EBY24_09830 [Betaproteobacteria bacterium]|nr:hypothetical protein [Betaproteobacteria bacterium]